MNDQQLKQFGDLLSVPRIQRDTHWRQQFFARVPDAPFYFAEPQVRLGPDNFPYAMLHWTITSENALPVSIRQITDWASQQCLGVALIYSDGQPTWIFSFGELWKFKESGEFKSVENQPAVISGGEVLVGSPSEALLPAYVRKQIKQIASDSGISEPLKVILVNSKDGAHALGFSVFRDEFSDEASFNSTMRSIRWHLPEELGLLAMSKDSDFAKMMQPL